ncbi:MAG: TIGR03663 family protein, partial [Candidatus Promineifilaceae bacterium]|nr:TIGR03663 family protein [Candidatus Promineifilaceae bacterium]
MTDIRKTTSSDGLLDRPLAFALRLDWEKILYGAIILLSLITRLAGVGDRVVSHDESLHTQYSFQYYNGDGYQHTALMHGPTLFHITALSYWLFGVSDTAARIPVALVGTILVILPYFLKDWIGRYGALFASVLLLISPYISYYSRYIRHDIYVITAASLTFIAVLHYLTERKEKYLWWFAIGLALMFTTMETAYIYVAIFGSYLILALIFRTVTADWFSAQFEQVRVPLAVVALALLMIAGGFLGQRLEREVGEGAMATPATITEEGFAADPDEMLDEAAAVEEVSPLETAMRWLLVSGLFVLGGGLLLLAFRVRPNLDKLPEFDLVVLTATLTLPTASAFLVTLIGADPLAYSTGACQIVGQETLSAFRLFFARITDATCRTDFLASDALVTTGFLVTTLVISVLVGLWWHRRRFLIAAAIFHGIFLLLFTSMFSNPGGWVSGMVGSLGYWLDQQEVQRANQPTYFYLIVLPLYEFLPLLLTLAAARLWARSARVGKVIGYWLLVTLSTLFAYSFSNWLVNRTLTDPEEHSRVTGMIVGGVVLVLSAVYWFFVRRRQLHRHYNLSRGWRSLTSVNSLIGIIPYLLWWFIASWIIYSLAGEKMAWLSSHFIMPMVLLAGWYFNRKVETGNQSQLFSRKFLIVTLLAVASLVALFLALLPVLLGQVTLGGQQFSNLNMLGRVLGALLVAAGAYFWFSRAASDLESRTKRRAWLFAGIGLLALLTIRFSYMANFLNADYVTEYLVYAHGAPATKSQVLDQLEELSMRLHGDKSIRVAYDNDSSWPMTWYLRDYPSRIYYGENPGRNITDAPVVIAGSQNWAKVEPLLGDDYDSKTYTFLWWPMEQYRNISWNALLGDPTVEPDERRGLGDPGVRQALWDIFFYRDYEKYGEVFGGNYSIGQWPLRHELRMYIRKDTLATIWDHGVRAAAIEPPIDPYAANVLERLPERVLSAGAEDGTPLQQPRNMATAADGTTFVADSGNHRVVVYDAAGQFI